MGDGRIVVVNAGSSAIRHAGERRHLREVGGEGEGRGELLLPARIWGLPEDSVAVFDGRTSRVTVLDPAGELARTVPLTRVDTLGIPSVHTAFVDGTLAEPRPVTRDVVARLVEHRAEAVPAEERAAVTRWVEGLPLPSELPAYDEMGVDALGHLWVRQYRPPWAEGPQRWWVFDPEGAWLGAVETLAQVWVDEIGEGHILGVETDEMGVEFVVVLGLERGD